ncbi:glycerol-3-phosphate 1-O-acyltransferase, partial [Pseudidiomarina aestuarii]
MRLQAFWRTVLYWPIRLLTRFEIILDRDTEQSVVGTKQVVYIMRSTSAADHLVARAALVQANLPSIDEPLLINGQSFARLMYVAPSETQQAEAAVDEFQQLLQAHERDSSVSVQLVPVGVFWGRKSGQERR